MQLIEKLFVCFAVKDMEAAVRVASQAYCIEDSSLVFSQEELEISHLAASLLLAHRVPKDADMALLLHTSDPSAIVGYWKGVQAQFPDDFVVTLWAGCICMFDAYAGADPELGVYLLQQAHAMTESHPISDEQGAIGILYAFGVANFQLGRDAVAKSFFTRFLQRGVAYGHRKVGEAHFRMGLLCLGISEECSRPVDETQ